MSRISNQLQILLSHLTFWMKQATLTQRTQRNWTMLQVSKLQDFDHKHPYLVDNAERVSKPPRKGKSASPAKARQSNPKVARTSPKGISAFLKSAKPSKVVELKCSPKKTKKTARKKRKVSMFF